MSPKPIPPPLISRLWLSLALLFLAAAPLRADSFGLFTYRIVDGTTIEITGYPQGATGPVVIPAEIVGKPVTSIAYMAFYGCRGLTSVAIPPSVTTIGGGAFAYCSGLGSIDVEAGNTQYASAGGVLFNVSLTTLIAYPAGKAGAYSIPSSVTSIGAGAFSICTGLTSVSIPSSVTLIGYYAFSGCSGLASVTIPSSVTLIGDSAFSQCSRLTSVTIPPSITLIGDYAFSQFSGLTSVIIPSSVRSIGNYAFSTCRRLTSVIIPSSVTGIADHAFESCTGLTSVTIPSSVTRIGDYSFSESSGLANVTIPSSVTSIGRYAFYWCSRLTSVTIPSSVTSIGDHAFSDCYRLAGVTIPSSVTSIADYGFSGCSGLTSVTIPSSVTSIGSAAFYGCTGLTSVTIPPSVTSIGAYAFESCTELTKAVFLGNTPSFFGADMFGGAAPGFTIVYLSSRTGFSSPTWQGYAATGIDEAVYPAAAWLLRHGLEHDANLHSDPDGDGVSLLMAYALDVDPVRNTPSRLPVPVMGAGTMSLNFKAGKPGVLYRVETSADLTGPWTTAGVTQSAPGADGQVTATVTRDGPERFLRLFVQD